MTESIEADVVVVGAGVHGSSAALHLARAGKKTVLLEQLSISHSSLPSSPSLPSRPLSLICATSLRSNSSILLSQFPTYPSSALRRTPPPPPLVSHSLPFPLILSQFTIPPLPTRLVPCLLTSLPKRLSLPLILSLPVHRSFHLPLPIPSPHALPSQPWPNAHHQENQLRNTRFVPFAGGFLQAVGGNPGRGRGSTAERQRRKRLIECKPSPLLVLGTKEKQPLMEKMAESAKESGNAPMWLSPAIANNMFGLGCGSDTLAFIDSSGGVLMADKCVATLQRLFRAAHGMLLERMACRRD
ncbi:hypothetical protein C7M84_014775 [Penaeus vannamei]|uniref:FAD dependent oxidoreductase domain-containing protein n=1 Tax=Penaeus vannamei TaxID=6689 RepID=A0A423SSG7_PENVA|nr:hypothetical protein C7M84_014775 [Penaeus vannamei]